MDKITELAFTQILKRAGIPLPVQEFKFHPSRRWRFDFAWPNNMVALEVEGGIWTAGRHTRGTGFLKDMEKYNAAAILGWRVLRTTPNELTRQETVEMLQAVLKGG